MIVETVAAAVAKIRADLPDVVARDRRAAQRAKGFGAWGAVIDDNKAEHIGPPLGLFLGSSWALLEFYLDLLGSS